MQLLYINSCCTSRNDKHPFYKANVDTDNEIISKRLKKQVEANDGNSITFLGCNYGDGSHGLQQDYDKMFELWTQAAELRPSIAHYQILGGMYYHPTKLPIQCKQGMHIMFVLLRRRDYS